LGLFAFSIALLQGLLVNNPADTTLVRAVEAMFMFCVIGLCVGYVGQRVLDEHAIRRHGEMFREVDEEEEASRGSQAAPAGTGQAAGGEAKAAASPPAPNP